MDNSKTVKIDSNQSFVFYENGCWPIEINEGENDVSVECAEYCERVGYIKGSENKSAKPTKNKSTSPSKNKGQ